MSATAGPQSVLPKPWRHSSSSGAHPCFDHRARLADKTTISELGERRWSVVQRLVDAEEEADWCVEAIVDLGADGADPDGPLLAIRRIGE